MSITMKQRKSLAILLIVAMLVTMFSPGIMGPVKVSAAEEVIEIRTMVDLYNVRNNPSGHYVLMNDIDLMGYNWTPIPGFIGTFDGNGHKIKNLTINSPSVNYVGLFDIILQGGKVKNLVIENANVSGGNYVGALAGRNRGTITNVGVEGGEVSGNDYVGGLVGNNVKGTIQQAYATGDVTGQGSFVGGLVGSNYDQSTIQQAYATGDVTGQGSLVGGLVGNNSFQSTIQQAYATGDVTGQGNSVGGLVGENYYKSTIQQAYATGDVTGENRVGGLVGNVDSGKVENVFALNGKVQGTSNVGKAIGYRDAGTVSNVYAPSHAKEHGKYITDLLTEEQVFEQSTYQNAGFDFTEVWQMDQAGLPVLKFHPEPVTKIPTFTDKPYLKIENGVLYNIIYTVQDLDRVREKTDVNYQLANDIDLMGYNWTPILNFIGTFDGNGHKIKNLTINSPSVNYVGLFNIILQGGKVKNLVIENANVSGGDRVGALAGRNRGTITNVGVEGGEVSGNDYVGGLVGDNYNGTIQQAYATGDVTGQGSYVGGLVGNNDNNSTIQQAYATGDVTGQRSYVGGLVGNNDNNSTIQQAYATGDVTGQGSYVGGLVGNNYYKSTIQQAYATGDVTGQGDSVGGLVGLNRDRSTIQQAYATGDVTGENRVGGLVGNVDSGKVENVFALNGKVQGTSNAGKAIGYRDVGTVSNVYAISTMSGEGHDQFISQTITPQQALQQMTYNMAGFEFGIFTGNPIWGIDEGESLPYLVFAPFKVGYNPSTGKWIYPETEATDPIDVINADPSNVTVDDLIDAGIENVNQNYLNEYRNALEQYKNDLGRDMTQEDIQKVIDAINAVKEAENNPTQANIDNAQNAIDQLEDGNLKDELQNRLDQVRAGTTPEPVVSPVGTGKLLVEWNYPPNDETVVGVKLYLFHNGQLVEEPVTVNKPETSYTFTGLDDGEDYTVAVTYVYGDGTESEPGEQIGTPEPIRTEYRYEYVITQPGNGGRIEYRVPVIIGGGGVTKEKITIIVPPGVSVGEPIVDEDIIRVPYEGSLQPGDTITIIIGDAPVPAPGQYESEIIIRDESGNVVERETQIIIVDEETGQGDNPFTPEPIDPPQAPDVEPAPDGKSLTVVWIDPVHPAFTGVHVYIKPIDGEYGTPVYVAPGVQHHVFTGLTPGQSYATKTNFLFGDVEIPGVETVITMPDEQSDGGQQPGQGDDNDPQQPGQGDDSDGQQTGSGDQNPGQGDDDEDNTTPITLRSPVAKLVDNSRSGVTIEANEVDNGLVYILKRSKDNGPYVEVARTDATGTGKVTLTDTTIELKTTYSYVVEVQNGSAKATSNKVVVTTPVPEDEEPFTETPRLTVKAKTADSVTLEATAINRATEYILYRKDSTGSFVEIARKSNGDSLIFTDTGLEEKTTYTYRLEATNGKVSVQSAPISVTTEARPPETPILVTAKLVGAAEPQGLMGKLMAGIMSLMGASSDPAEKPTVEVAWTEGEVKAQAFVVYRQEDGGAIRQVKTILSGQGNVFVDEKVKEGSTYVYYVEALKDGMRSDKAQSNPIEIPQTLTRGWAENPLTVVQEGDHVKISWVPAAGEVSKYFLYRIDTSNPLYKQSIAVLSGDVTEFMDSKAKKGRTYIYVIKAVYREGPNNEHTEEYESDPITIR